MIPASVPELGRGAWCALLAALFSSRARKERLVAELEGLFADFTGVRHAVFLNSARQALYLLYRHARVEGRRVLSSPYTCIPAADAIRWAGGTPLFADIDLATYNLAYDPRLEDAGDDVAAVCLTYLYGLIADPAPLVAWARARGAFIVEDAAIALGARVGGRRAGSFGDAGVFSLQSSKIVSAWRGAIVTTPHDDVARFLRAERSESRTAPSWKVIANALVMEARRACASPALYRWTFEPMREFVTRPFGARLLAPLLDQDPSEALSGEGASVLPATETRRPAPAQAALALAGARHLGAITARRREIAARFSAALADIPEVVLPVEPPGVEHAYGRYPIRVPGVAKAVVARALARRGVETLSYYPYIIPATHTGGTASESLGPLTHARTAARETLLLPMHTALRERDIDRIVHAVRAAAVSAPAIAVPTPSTTSEVLEEQT